MKIVWILLDVIARDYDYTSREEILSFIPNEHGHNGNGMLKAMLKPL